MTARNTPQTLPPVARYPRTVHLFDTGGTAISSDDLIVQSLSVAYESFRNSDTVVEEKVDGANLGFRCDNGEILVQNRSRYISSGDHAQFSRIHEWVDLHRAALFEILKDGLVLYGEWCAARHSIPYKNIPDYFCAFDLFDTKAERFYSRRRFHSALDGTGVAVVPTIGVRAFGQEAEVSTAAVKNRKRKGSTKKKTPNHLVHGIRGREEFSNQIRALLETRSAFRNDGGPVEGVVLRHDDENWMLRRFKVVRPDFVQGCAGGHWFHRPIEKQLTNFAFGQSYLQECYVFSTARRQQRQPDNSFGTEISSDNAKREPLNIDKLESTCPTNHAKDNDPMEIKKLTKAELKRQAEVERQLIQNQKKARRCVPRCVMLMGLPGSGKSTFAKKLHTAFQKDGYASFLANQDDLGNKPCIQMAGKASSRTRVIVDRCHLTRDQRREWLRCLHSPARGEVALVYFCATMETCVERVQNREHHPTIANGKGAWIVRQLAGKLEPPTEEERKLIFGTVEMVRTFQESNALLRRWGVVPFEDC